MKKIVTLLVSCVWAIATYAHEIAPEEALQPDVPARTVTDAERTILILV